MADVQPTEPDEFAQVAANAVNDKVRRPDGRIRPAIDRAIRRDHSVCDIDPCSDCR